jgi:hypothetical protein
MRQRKIRLREKERNMRDMLENQTERNERERERERVREREGERERPFAACGSEQLMMPRGIYVPLTSPHADLRFRDNRSRGIAAAAA